MTIREQADVEIDKLSGTVSVCSRHSLQHTNQRIVGAVSVLFVLKDHEEVNPNSVEKGNNQEDSKGSCYGYLDNIKHFNAIPASLSVVELPFGGVMNQIIGTNQTSEVQHGLCSMKQSLQNLTRDTLIANNNASSAEDLHVKVSHSKAKMIDGNDSEVSLNKNFLSNVETDDSFSFYEVSQPRDGDYGKDDMDKDSSKISISMERKVSIGKKSDPKCFTCGEILDTYEKVIAHCKLHNLLKTCPICAFEFSGMKNNLKRHCLSHMQRPIYKCPHRTCNSTFGRKDNLRKHLMRHEHKMANPRLSLQQQKVHQLKGSRRKLTSSYNLPTLVKIPSRIEGSLNLLENNFENIGGDSNQPSLPELYVEESLLLEDSGMETSDCLTIKSTGEETSSMYDEVPIQRHDKEENITISPLVNSKFNGVITKSEARTEKKVSIDSVISRISKKATLPFNTVLDTKIQDSFYPNSSRPDHQSDCDEENVSNNLEEYKTYTSHSQGEVVFPERNADKFNQMYTFENEFDLNIEDVNASEEAIRSNHYGVSDDEQSLNSSEDVTHDDSSQVSYTTIQKQVDLPLKCKYCSKAMESYGKIMDHVDDHIDEVRHRLTCVVCASEFSSKDCLRRHARNHFGIKFQCNLCSNSYSRNDNLNKHMRESHGIDVRKKLRLY